MKFAAHILSQLQHALELMEPVLEAMRNQDHSELFLDLAPGLAEEVYGLVRHAAGQLIQAGWVAGRRGRITQSLMAALRHLQQGRYTPTSAQALIHLGTASRHLRDAATALSRWSRVRHSRR